MEKYGQLYDLGQLSDFGIYRYAWACLMSDKPHLAYTVLSDIQSYDYFENNKYDIYGLYGFVCQDLEKYSEAANYFELSNNKIYKDTKDWKLNIKNFIKIGDCLRYDSSYTQAIEQYQKALVMFCHFNEIDFEYFVKDCKNLLKKNQKSYRDDDADYSFFYMIYCSMKSGDWTVSNFLHVCAELARAGNKYAKRELNNSGINPYGPGL